MAAASTPTPYLGSKISLISKSEIRYEGILYTVDTKESTIALAKVKSFGTEDRPTEHPVPARDDVYEYIIFKAVDIKDLMVCEVPKQVSCLVGGLPNDPAIVQISTGQPPPNGANSHAVQLIGLGHPGGRQLKDLGNSKDSSDESGKAGSKRSDQKSGSRQKRKSQSRDNEGGNHQQRGERNHSRQRQNRQQQQDGHNQNSKGTSSRSRNNGGGDRSGNRRDNSRSEDRRHQQRQDYQVVPFIPRGHQQDLYAMGYAPRGYIRSAYGGMQGGQIGVLPFQRGEVVNGGRNNNAQGGRYNNNGGEGGRRYGPMIGGPRMGGGYYPDRRAYHQDLGYYNLGGGGGNNGQQQQRRRYDYESTGRMPRQPYRGSQQRLQQLKFEGDYDFEEANQQFKETLEKLSGVKISEQGEEGKENATDGEKKADDTVEEGEIKDEKFYDKTKSFFDAISCESIEKNEQKPNDKGQRGVQRQKNQETFGQSSIRSYGYGGYRRFPNRGPMRNVPLRYRS